MSQYIRIKHTLHLLINSVYNFSQLTTDAKNVRIFMASSILSRAVKRKGKRLKNYMQMSSSESTRALTPTKMRLQRWL